MPRSGLRRLIRSIKKKIPKPVAQADSYLQACKGVIHVGANIGHEAPVYSRAGLRVVWFEPIPSVFDRLVDNIAGYDDQTAINGLVTDVDGKTYSFNISDNDGLSSSIFKMKGHKQMWPKVGFADTVELASTTLPIALKKNQIDLSEFDALILDTQGSELLVLKGAEAILDKFSLIRAEAADFEAYEGCSTLDEITSWLKDRGFELVHKNTFKDVEGLGAYCDATYLRVPGE